MYTVGLITETRLKTYSFSTRKDAVEGIRNWKTTFLNNNYVKSRKTIISRNEIGEIIEKREIFTLSNKQVVTMFMNENEGNK